VIFPKDRTGDGAHEERDMCELRVETLTFTETEKERWYAGHDDMLLNSPASPFLKRVLTKKHARRPKKFFGEAFVASHRPHDEGYYSSFKWLTASSWASADDLAATDAAEFKRALATHFPKLAQFQARAAEFARSTGGPKPVAPDLWLVVNGEHQFVEVKLANDRVAEHQLAGLALIAKWLPSDAPLSVILVNLDNATDQFSQLANRLTV
jgi:hypothetical protein